MGGGPWNLLLSFLCFSNTNIYTAVLFQIEGCVQQSCLLPRLVWEGEVELWTVEQKEEERRERALPSSITQYLNPIPLELREAGRKMPLPRQPPLLFVGCWLFTKEITCKLGSGGQNKKNRGSNLQVITESPRNNFQNTKISFVSYLLLLK